MLLSKIKREQYGMLPAPKAGFLATTMDIDRLQQEHFESPRGHENLRSQWDKEMGVHTEGRLFPAGQDPTERPQHLEHLPKLAVSLKFADFVARPEEFIAQLAKNRQAYSFACELAAGPTDARNQLAYSGIDEYPTEAKVTSSSVDDRKGERDALDWLEQNHKLLEGFPGEWVLIVGSDLIAHSTLHRDIFRIVKDRRPVGALMHYVPRPEEANFVL